MEINEFRNDFLVAPSSISPYASLGLYSKVFIPKGKSLPFVYPGKSMPIGKYDTMHEELAHYSQIFDGDKNKPMTDPQVADILRRLEEHYGIYVRKAEKSGIDKVWRYDDTSDLANTYVNWDNLIDQIGAYAFGAHRTDNEEITYVLRNYSNDGSPIFDPRDINNRLLMANEPPTYDFVNLVTLKVQQSKPNLLQHEENGQIVYKAYRDIQPGDELLICYGPGYSFLRKGYSINMDRNRGCGEHEILYSGNYIFGLPKKKDYRIKPQYLDQQDNDVVDVVDPQSGAVTRMTIVEKYINEIYPYVHDNTPKLVELSQDQLDWFNRNVEPNYAEKYRQFQRQFGQVQPQQPQQALFAPNPPSLPAAETKVEKLQRHYKYKPDTSHLKKRKLHNNLFSKFQNKTKRDPDNPKYQLVKSDIDYLKQKNSEQKRKPKRSRDAVTEPYEKKYIESLKNLPKRRAPETVIEPPQVPQVPQPQPPQVPQQPPQPQQFVPPRIEQELREPVPAEALAVQSRFRVGQKVEIRPLNIFEDIEKGRADKNILNDIMGLDRFQGAYLSGNVLDNRDGIVTIDLDRKDLFAPNSVIRLPENYVIDPSILQGRPIPNLRNGTFLHVRADFDGLYWGGYIIRNAGSAINPKLTIQWQVHSPGSRKYTTVTDLTKVRSAYDDEPLDL